MRQDHSEAKHKSKGLLNQHGAAASSEPYLSLTLFRKEHLRFAQEEQSGLKILCSEGATQTDREGQKAHLELYWRLHDAKD